MVKALVRKWFNRLHENSSDPWATFEIAGFEADGRVKVTFNWNKAFIEQIEAIGFKAETDEDTVQLFFYTSQMRPSLMGEPDEDPIQSSAHPSLSAQSNVLRV